LCIGGLYLYRNDYRLGPIQGVGNGRHVASRLAQGRSASDVAIPDIPRNADEQIVSHADTDCANDSEACVLAESLLQPGQQAEIWQGLRRVRLVSLYTGSDRNRLIN